jgi:hypothetical protein
MADRHILYTLDMKGNLNPKAKELAGHLHLVGKEAKATETKVGDLRKLIASFGGDITSTGGRLANLAEGLSAVSGSLGTTAVRFGAAGLAVAALGVAFYKATGIMAGFAQSAGEAEQRIRGLGLMTAEQALGARELAAAYREAQEDLDALTVELSVKHKDSINSGTKAWAAFTLQLQKMKFELFDVAEWMATNASFTPWGLFAKGLGFGGGVAGGPKKSRPLTGTSMPGMPGYGVLQGPSGGLFPGAATPPKSSAGSFGLPAWMSSALTGNAEMMANLNSSIMAGQSAATLASFTNAPTGSSSVFAALRRGRQANFADAGIGSIAPPAAPFLPGFGKTLGAGVGGLATGLGTVASGGNITSGLLGMLGGPVGMLASTLGGTLASGGSISKVTDGLIDQAKAIPTIVRGIVEAVPDIMTALIKAAPEILQSLVKVLLELPIILIKGIGEAIADIFKRSPEEKAAVRAGRSRNEDEGYLPTKRGVTDYSRSSVVVINNSRDPIRDVNELRKALGPYGRGGSLAPLPV